MHWWPSEIPLGWKRPGSQCTLGPDPVDAVVVKISSLWSLRKVKRLFPTEPPR
jgi:hypothetical protein